MEIEIVVEQRRKTWWENEGLILREIEKQSSRTDGTIKYPNEAFYDTETLGAINVMKAMSLLGFCIMVK